MTILVDSRYIFASSFGAGGRNKRSLPQAAVDQNYKKAMIGNILYRQFVIAHTVLDYEDSIFTGNVKAIKIKHLIKVLADGSEYHRFYTDELELEKDAVLLPEDQQPKTECPPCAVCACVECEACADCVEKTSETTETIVPSDDATVPATVSDHTTTPKTATSDDIISPEDDNIEPEDNIAPEDDNIAPNVESDVNSTSSEEPEVISSNPIPCNKPHPKPNNRKYLKNGGRPHSNSQQPPKRNKAPRNRPTQKGSKYLKNPMNVSPKMAPIDC